MLRLPKISGSSIITRSSTKFHAYTLSLFISFTNVNIIFYANSYHFYDTGFHRKMFRVSSSTNMYFLYYGDSLSEESCCTSSYPSQDPRSVYPLSGLQIPGGYIPPIFDLHPGLRIPGDTPPNN